MPRDPKKREKEVMKRRRHQKEAAKARHQSQVNALDTPRAVLRHARSFPIYECLISESWKDPDDTSLVQVLLARKQPDGDIVFGGYLVDRLCLGLKDTFCRTHTTLADYEDEIKAPISDETPLETCPPELAHQMIYGAIDYAAQFGFRPQRDFVDSQLILEMRGTLAETYDLTFGKDGKPYFISGPYDNVPLILGRVEKHPGPGNYNLLINVDPLDLDLDPLDLDLDGEEPGAAYVLADEGLDDGDDLSDLDFVDADDKKV